MGDLVFEMTFSTHGIKVHRYDGNIHCWKYTNKQIDYECFDTEEAAIEYITTPPPSLGWRVEITEL